MSKENRTQTLINVGAEEASTCFDAHISQDEASYDGDVSNADEEDIDVVPDEVDDTQIKSSKPAEADTVTDKEVPKATNKEDGVTLVDGSTLQGCEWASVPWYPDTPETGATLQELSLFIKICK